jgi:hypothetical protein
MNLVRVRRSALALALAAMGLGLERRSKGPHSMTKHDNVRERQERTR